MFARRWQRRIKSLTWVLQVGRQWESFSFDRLTQRTLLSRLPGTMNHDFRLEVREGVCQRVAVGLERLDRNAAG